MSGPIVWALIFVFTTAPAEIAEYQTRAQCERAGAGVVKVFRDQAIGAGHTYCVPLPLDGRVRGQQ